MQYTDFVSHEMEELLKAAIADSMSLGLRHRSRDLATQLAVLEAIEHNEDPNVDEVLLGKCRIVGIGNGSHSQTLAQIRRFGVDRHHFAHTSG